jgi:hypothetical protein
MASNASYTTSNIPTRGMGEIVDEMVNAAKSTRRGHERRWYDNNFFDDGYHFRYVSRQANKIVDLATKATIYDPMRAIPKASRQLRGIVNLLVSNNYVPICYPEKIEKANYPEIESIDPMTGQPVMAPNPEYQQALEIAREIARKEGHWLTEEFKNQNILEKTSHMVLLAGKHSVSFLKIWPDAVSEKIKTATRDAFDIYILGNYTELEDLPFMVEVTPRLISEIKADENFDEDQVKKITPDNRLASSEIKEAYMTSRFGGRPASDQAATLLQKEAFIKEYLNRENMKVIRKQKNGGEILKARGEGDPIMRHVFSAGNIWLKDEYLDMDSYPYADFRFEEGPLYQVPQIERFIPSNKSLDMIASRVERYAHTMGVGVWLKRQGEQFKITNQAGGLIAEYSNVPPQQMQLQSIPPFFFNYMGMLNTFIEEQGVSTTTLGKIPSGVKAAAAIESLKESEYANLVVPNQQLKKSLKRIAEKFLVIADDYFVSPQSVYYLERGEPQYFDIIGSSGKERREAVNVETPEDVVPISKSTKVDIEIQSGPAYTREGQKAAAKELGDYLLQLAQLNMVPPAVVVEYINQLFEIYQFGAASEVAKNVEEFTQEGMMTNPQMDAMKVAMAEVIRDAGIRPQPEQDERIQETKVAIAETAKDLQGGGRSE